MITIFVFVFVTKLKPTATPGISSSRTL